MSKHLVIFSHGFGVRQDDRGLFTDIADGLAQDIVPVLFDYNEIDESSNTMKVRPFSRQVEIFKKHYGLATTQNPRLPVIVIAHSQGCLIAAMAEPKVQKALMLAPAPELNIERLVKNFADRPGVEVNLEGVSKLTRRDGSSTLIDAEYVKEINTVKPVEAYNRLAGQTELIIVSADNDEVLGRTDYTEINAGKVLHLAANHDFTGASRGELIDLLKKELQ